MQPRDLLSVAALLAALLSAAPLRAAEEAEDDPPVLRLAMSSPLGLDIARKEARQLSEVLATSLQRKVIGEVVDAKDLPKLLADGGVDLGWVSAAEYVAAAKATPGVIPAAKLVRGGLPFYRAVIFAPKKSVKLKKLGDLKGKRIAFVSQQSAAGYRLPHQMIRAAGLETKDLGEEQFLGDHLAVCTAVLEGKVDAGATFSDDRKDGPGLDGCAETVGERVKELRVLAASAPIPNDLVALRPGLGAKTQAAVRAALLSLKDTEKGRAMLQELFHAEGFTSVDDADFTPLRDVQQ